MIHTPPTAESIAKLSKIDEVAHQVTPYPHEERIKAVVQRARNVLTAALRELDEYEARRGIQ